MSSLTGQDQHEEELFERAQAKLDEAFALLRTLEGQLRASEGRRQQAHLDVESIVASLENAVVDLAVIEQVTAETEALEPALKLDVKADVITPALAEGISRKPVRAPRPSEVRRAEERDQLLAYVENAHAEALRLKESRPRPLSRAERKELVRRITERVAEVAAQLEVRESGTTPWEESGRHSALEPTTVAHVSEIDEGRVTRSRADTVIASDDERQARARAETMIAPPRPIEVAPASTVDPARRTDEHGLLTRSSSGTSHVDIKVPAAEVVTVVAPTPSDTVELPPLPRDLYENPDTEAETFVPTLITANPMLEREKSGARQRRDRSPTEVMERTTGRNTAILGRYSRRTVLIASAIVAGVMMIAGVSFFVSRVARTPLPIVTEAQLKPVPAEPAALEAAPAAVPAEPTQVRTTRKAVHVSPTPASKATPKCANAKCRGSTAGHARNTNAAAMVQAPVVNKTAVSPGRIGSLARRDTINAAPSIAAKPSVKMAQVRSP